MVRILIYSARLPNTLGDMTVKTARYHHRNAEIIHLTDMDAKPLEGVDQVWRKPWIEGFPVLLQFDHMAELDNKPTIYLDNDILVRGNLESAFVNDFDVALTLRTKVEDEEQPYNCGVMFSRSGKFFWSLRKRMEESPIYKHMHHIQAGVASEAKSGEWLVKELPCATWNYSPARAKHSLFREKVLHYKGDRKAYMKEHFDQKLWIPGPN